jgi:hypothetical protein
MYAPFPCKCNNPEKISLREPTFSEEDTEINKHSIKITLSLYIKIIKLSINYN